MNQSTRSAIKRTGIGRRLNKPAMFVQETPRLPRWRKQRRKLLKLRNEVLQAIQQLKAAACEESPNYSMHMADAATDSFDRDLVLGLASFEQEGLYEIDAALKRIESGTYGICELTGQPIAWRRLEAIPCPRFSLEAAKQIEGFLCPHLGQLGTVRPPEAEASEAAQNGDANQERGRINQSQLLPFHLH
jgi:DnaK suppressor protein